MPPAIRRAESCDSVASDSSVLEMQPDMPKIGQLEFALEYDRYSIKTIAFDADNDLKKAKHVPVCVNHSFYAIIFLSKIVFSANAQISLLNSKKSSQRFMHTYIATNYVRAFNKTDSALL